jgi:hypothetical protein
LRWLRDNPDCAAFNPTLLDGEQGKKRDDCGTGQNSPQGLPLLFGHALLDAHDLFGLATLAAQLADRITELRIIPSRTWKRFLQPGNQQQRNRHFIWLRDFL